MKAHLTRYIFEVTACAVLTLCITTSCQDDKSTNDAKIEGMQKKLEGIMAEYQALKNDYDYYLEGLYEKDSTIERQEKEINRLIGQLNSQKNSSSRGEGLLQAQVDSLQSLYRQYCDEAARLRTEKESLSSQLADLKTQIVRLQEENAQLSSQVEKASRLTVASVSVTPAKSVTGSSVSRTSRASKVTAISVSGRLQENHVVKPGPKAVAVRIVGPEGKVISEQNQQFEFNGSARDFSIIWSRPAGISVLKPGLYEAVLMEGGEVISVKTFALK